jgi:hypothetical protein
MAAPSYVDPRRSPRGRAANPIRLAIPFEYPTKQHKALTVDASLHGIKIRTDVPLSPGERVVILPEAGSGVRIPARVVWTRAVKISAGYVAGLEFAKPLTPLAGPQLRPTS